MEPKPIVELWNCTHFRHPTDEQLGHVDIYFSNYYNLQSVYFDSFFHFIHSFITISVLIVNVIKAVDALLATIQWDLWMSTELFLDQLNAWNWSEVGFRKSPQTLALSRGNLTVVITIFFIVCFEAVVHRVGNVSNNRLKCADFSGIRLFG